MYLFEQKDEDKERKMSSPPQKCIFCQQKGNLTKEHVYGNWLNKFITTSELGTHSNAGFSYTSQPNNTINNIRYYETSRRQGKVTNTTARVVCSTCNNGWMRDNPLEK